MGFQAHHLECEERDADGHSRACHHRARAQAPHSEALPLVGTVYPRNVKGRTVMPALLAFATASLGPRRGPGASGRTYPRASDAAMSLGHLPFMGWKQLPILNI